MIKVYTDAAVLYHDNKSAGGILIVTNNHQEQIKVSLPASDNHNAEFNTYYLALKKLIEILPHPANEIISQYTDSKIVYDSLEKHYAKHYQNWVDKIIILESNFNLVFHNLISDRQNSGAHELAQQALHQDK